jgi:hypothetical protein
MIDTTRAENVKPANDTGVQRRMREGAQRPTHPTDCNALLDGRPRRATFRPTARRLPSAGYASWLRRS